MLSVFKMSAGNAEEIAIASKHISSIIYFIEGIYIIMPSEVAEVIAGIIIIFPQRQES